MSALSTPHIEALLQSNQLWRAREFTAAHSMAAAGVYTGFAALDAVLPTHAWPVGQLCELMGCQAGSGEWSLMQPALRAALASKPAAQLVLINPSHEPYLPAWAANGIAPEQVLRIDTSALPQAQQKACWAAEQALHCADVVAVVAWLPGASAQALRRLQLAASQSQALVFVLRPLAAREQSSSAALRLLLQRTDVLHSEIHILKSRGAAAQNSIRIELLSPALRALLQARKRNLARMTTPMSAAPISITTTQTSTATRMTPRSQGIGLLPDALLFGNERAAEGPAQRPEQGPTQALNMRAHHGLDRTTTSTLHPDSNFNFNFNFITSPAISANANIITPAERARKREARHARSR